VAQEGKPRTKTGRNMQTSHSSDSQADKSDKTRKGTWQGNTQNAAQWHVFQAKLQAPGSFRYLQKY